MNNKLINKEIRKVSNFSSLPVLVFIVLSLVIQYSFVFAMRILNGKVINLSEDMLYLILYCLQYFVIAGAAMIVFFLARRKSTGLTLTSTFRKPQMPTSWIIKWLIIGTGFGYITSLVTNLMYTAIQKILGIEFTELETGFSNSPLGVFGTILAVTILAPIFEELMFRGTIYRNTEILGQPFAMVMSGIVFGLWHMNYTQIVFAAVLGVIMAYMYAKTRSIFPSILLHFSVNTISTIVMLSTENLDMDKISAYDLEYMMQHFFQISIMSFASMAMYGLMIASIVLFIIELVKHRHQFKMKPSVFPVSLGKKIAVYFSAPITIIVFAYMIIKTVMNALSIFQG